MIAKKEEQKQLEANLRRMKKPNYPPYKYEAILPKIPESPNFAGRLDILRWWIEEMKGGGDKRTVAAAAKGGHLEVVKWLVDGGLPCSSGKPLPKLPLEYTLR